MARAKKKIICQDCDKIFRCRAELQQHRREEHSRKNMCPICKRVFESEKRLRMHSQFHNVGGEYKCFYCSKRFNKGWKMKIHLVNHSGKPSYICQFCGDDFLYPGKIVAHLKRIHDVICACKECGQVVGHMPHKCKIYGCKDCLMYFASEEELAAHIKTSKHDELYNIPSPSIENVNLNYVTFNSKPDIPRDDTKEEADILEIGILVDKNAKATDDHLTRASREPECTSPVTLDSGRGSTSPEGSEGLCEGSKGLFDRSPSPDKPIKLLVSDARSETEDFKVLLQGHWTPNKASVIKADTEDKKEVSSLSYTSSVLLKPQWSQFKVPDTSKRPKEKRNNVKCPARWSLRRKQDEPSKTSKREMLNTFQLYMDTDARLTQCSQTSFESWLSSDSFTSPEHDYVFGFEASVSVGSHREETHYHYFNKKILKKEKVDMTFEDLCLF